MPIGYDRPLYLLPFDHRASFEHDLFKFEAPLTPAQIAEVSASKQAVYQGFERALQLGAPVASVGILVDEEFGGRILETARDRGEIICLPVERSGQAEFLFGYGNSWRDHILRFAPNFVKVLVRYNPRGEVDLNRRQAGRLAELSAFVHESGSRLLFELLVPMTHQQYEQVDGSQLTFDRDLRPELMVGAIEELQAGGVEPDIWKVEGLYQRADAQAVGDATRRGSREGVGCIVLGRGADKASIIAWLEVAAACPAFIGFAVGRTSFWEALVGFRDGRLTQPEVAQRIADNFLEWIEIFETAKRAA